jgi:hypothetical protein
MCFSKIKSGVRSASHRIDTRGLFFRGWNGRGVKPTIYLHLAPGLRMRGAIPPPPASRLHGVHRDSLTNSTKQRPSDGDSSAGEETPGPIWYPPLEPIWARWVQFVLATSTYTKAFQVSLHVQQMVPFPWAITCELQVPSVNPITVIHFSEFYVRNWICMNYESRAH